MKDKNGRPTTRIYKLYSFIQESIRRDKNLNVTIIEGQYLFCKNETGKVISIYDFLADEIKHIVKEVI